MRFDDFPDYGPFPKRVGNRGGNIRFSSIFIDSVDSYMYRFLIKHFCIILVVLPSILIQIRFNMKIANL